MERSTPMDHEASDRISATADRDPDSLTATTGFNERAEAAAERNDPSFDEYDEDLYDDEDDR
jgi:hypothetical protein